MTSTCIGSSDLEIYRFIAKKLSHLLMCLAKTILRTLIYLWELIDQNGSFPDSWVDYHFDLERQIDLQKIIIGDHYLSSSPHQLAHIHNSHTITWGNKGSSKLFWEKPVGRNGTASSVLLCPQIVGFACHMQQGMNQLEEGRSNKVSSSSSLWMIFRSCSSPSFQQPKGRWLGNCFH